MTAPACGSSSALFEQLKAAKRLPSPPGIAIRVLALCRREDASLGEIADVVMFDPVLSSRLLRFANSPMAGTPRRVASIREAVHFLGLRAVKLTALGFSLAAPNQEVECSGFSMKRFWAESFLRAVTARRLAGEFPGIDREEAFTAALLSGLGQLAMAHGLGEKYGQILEEAADGRQLTGVEREKLGVDHLALGVELLQEWSLPEILIQAVQWLGNPFEPGHVQAPGQQLGRIVRLAHELSRALYGRSAEVPPLPEDLQVLLERSTKLDPAKWPQIGREILTHYQEMAELFDVELESVASAMELCVEAQEEATRVGLAAQIEQTQVVKANEDLLRLATTDPLTGVANRAKLEERLKQEVAGLRRGHAHFALVLFDIDHFKKFNDTHGHQVGDLVLKQVATAVHRAVREVDLVARYGGEEFAVVLSHADRKGACIVVLRMQRCVEGLRIDVDGARLSVTISSGLVITEDYSVVPDVDRLIADADKQMYLSKRAGRNTWSYLGRSASRLADQVGAARTPPSPTTVSTP